MSIQKTKLFVDSWYVAYRKRKSDILDDKESVFTIIENQPHCWAADPFVIEHNNVAYIFAELYDSKRGRGVIGYCCLQDPQPEWKPVIMESYHMSYPHLFSDNGEIYLMPEANQSRTLYCYRAIDFPEKWEKLSPIRTSVRYVDTSPFEADGHHYAITYQIAEEEKDYKLVLLDLENQENDKIIETNNAQFRRPGGRIDAKRKIRVAQNCEDGYGKGLIFYQYQIQDGNYAESEMTRIMPEQIKLSKRIYLAGMHTYNCSEHFEVIDIKTRSFSLRRVFNKIKSIMSLRKAND